jgi:hypothetical protein
MKTKNILFWIVLIIMFCSTAVSVYSQQPFQTQTPTDEETYIEIVYPKIEQYVITKNITLNFDILNSTHHKLTNTTTNCSFNMVDSSGENVFSGVLNYFELGYWNTKINSENLSVGNYNYYVYCINTIQAGFVSSSLFISPKGALLDGNPIALVIALGIVGLIIIFMHKIMNQEHWLFKLMMVMFIPLIIITMASVAVQVSIGTYFEIAGSNFYKIAIWFIRLFYIYIIVSIAITAMNFFVSGGKKIK